MRERVWGAGTHHIYNKSSELVGCFYTAHTWSVQRLHSPEVSVIVG